MWMTNDRAAVRVFRLPASLSDVHRGGHVHDSIRDRVRVCVLCSVVGGVGAELCGLTCCRAGSRLQWPRAEPRSRIGELPALGRIAGEGARRSRRRLASALCAIAGEVRGSVADRGQPSASRSHLRSAVVPVVHAQLARRAAADRGAIGKRCGAELLGVSRPIVRSEDGRVPGAGSDHERPAGQSRRHPSRRARGRCDEDGTDDRVRRRRHDGHGVSDTARQSAGASRIACRRKARRSCSAPIRTEAIRDLSISRRARTCS